MSTRRRNRVANSDGSVGPRRRGNSGFFKEKKSGKPIVFSWIFMSFHGFLRAFSMVFHCFFFFFMDVHGFSCFFIVCHGFSRERLSAGFFQ